MPRVDVNSSVYFVVVLVLLRYAIHVHAWKGVTYRLFYILHNTYRYTYYVYTYTPFPCYVLRTVSVVNIKLKTRHPGFVTLTDHVRGIYFLFYIISALLYICKCLHTFPICVLPYIYLQKLKKNICNNLFMPRRVQPYMLTCNAHEKSALYTCVRKQ